MRGDGSQTADRGSRPRKENPRSRYSGASLVLAIHALRPQAAPDASSSCGTQPAHIRMIIVAAAVSVCRLTAIHQNARTTSG